MIMPMELVVPQLLFVNQLLAISTAVYSSQRGHYQ